MTNLTTLALVSASLLFATTTAALAEPGGASIPSTTPAAANALELTLATSYSRGAGRLGGDLPSAQDIAGPGSGLVASIGWRATPNLSIGGYLGVSAMGASGSWTKTAVALTAGLKADWHFLPAASLDPWVSVGTGLKAMEIDKSPDLDRTRTLTGLELINVQIGLDYRFSPHFALGPVIGASAAMFDHQYFDKMSDASAPLDGKKVSWTFSAGVLGRFDLLGTTR